MVVLIISSLICKKKDKMTYIRVKNAPKNAKLSRNSVISAQKMQKRGKIENVSALKLNKMQTLKVGIKGKDVKKLQSYLNLYVDGIFGKMTEESVKQFQKDNGLL